MVVLADGWGGEAISNDSTSEVFFTYCFSMLFIQEILQVAVISKFHKFVAETQTKKYDQSDTKSFSRQALI